MNGNNVVAHTPREQALLKKWFADVAALKKANSISQAQYDEIFDSYVDARDMVADHINKAGKETVNTAFKELHNKFKGAQGGRKSRKNRKNRKQRKTRRN
jgi:response regulator of citrate/malate metabolism